MLQWIILTPVRQYAGIDEIWFHDSINMQLYVLITISLPVWLYFLLLDSYKCNGTFGKRLMKLTVLNQMNHKRLTLKKSLIRTIFKLLPWEIAHIGVIFPVPIYYAENPNIRILTIIGLLLFMLYFMSIFFNKKSQSFYDQLLNTQVKQID
ncbi:MAG: RDD family protein [Marinicellaceae bacterium]